MMNKILFVEDDRLYADTVEDFLSESGFDVDIVSDGEAALDRLGQSRYDLYLIDLKLPKLGGFELLELIKNSGDERPSIILTSNMSAHVAVKCFLLGCDDYIRKNCDLAELLERIRRSIYRSYHTKNSQIDLGDGYIFDLSTKILMRNGEVVALKKKELQLLAILLRNIGQFVSKETIEEELWLHESDVSSGALRVYIHTLKKLFGSNRIVNVRDLGYKFDH